MKRFSILCVMLCLLFVLVPLLSNAEEAFAINSDIQGLLAHQDLLDEIEQNLTYMGSIGFTSKNLVYSLLQSQISSIIDEQAGRIYQSADQITLSGGVHFIDEPCELENVTLLNNAVLYNFGGSIRNLSLKDSAKYFGTSKGTAVNIIMERHSVAYLQDTGGERLTAAGNSEAFLFDAANYPVLYALEEAAVAIIGNNAVIDRGYIGKGANLFDPNARVAEIEWEEGRTQVATGGSSKKQETGPYPSNIMEWVFGSTPQKELVPEGACTCGCNCGNPCCGVYPSPRCCMKCECVIIR